MPRTIRQRLELLAPAPPAVRHARRSLFVLGAGSVGAQIILLREGMSAAGGNELVAGIAVGLWLLLTGLGSRWGGGFHRAILPNRVLRGHLLLAALPIFMLTALRALPRVVGVRGAVLGPFETLLGCFVCFVPYGLISGAMVPWAGGLGREEDAGRPTRRAYALDSAGCALGGALLSLLLVAGIPHGWCLGLFGAAHVWAASRLSPVPPRERSDRRLAGWAGIAAAVLLGSLLADGMSLRWRYPGQEVLESRNTPTGLIAVTRLGEQTNVFQDAVPLYSTGDRWAEARIHPALAQIPEGSSVLLVGGGLFGGIREAAKHEAKRIVALETNAGLWELGTRRDGRAPLLPDSGMRRREVETISGDGRAHLRGRSAAYDAILFSLPGPETAGWNRYYTEECFREVRGALRAGGIFSFTLASSANYLGGEQIALERSIRTALSSSFPEIVVLPGEVHLYLASDRPIDLEIEPILEARRVVTDRLLDYDWPELSDPFRRDELAALLAPDGQADRSTPEPNRDLSPRAFRHLLDRRARFDPESWPLVWGIVLLALAAAAAATRGRPLETAVATSGFSVMVLELVLLLLCQILFGNLYLRLAQFITLLLLGAALGALASPHLPGTPTALLRVSDAMLAVTALLLLATAEGTVASADPLVRGLLGHGVLPLLALAIAFPAGVQFAAAGALFSPPATAVNPAVALEAEAEGGIRPPESQQRRSHPGLSRPSLGAVTLGRLYWADLAGAGAGTILAGLILIPRGGVLAAVVAVVLIKSLSGILLAARLPRV